MSIIKYFKDYIDHVNEGLIKTLPGNIVLDDILKSLTHMNLSVSGEFDGFKLKLTIKDFYRISLNQIGYLFDHIDTFVINRGGWFPSSMNIVKLSDYRKNSKYDFHEIVQSHNEIDFITITYESKFDSLDYDIPDKLYHLTIKEYSSKIEKYGLFPKSKSKLSSHLDRIYLCKEYQDCEDLIPKMMFYYTGERDDNVYKYGKKLFNKDITPVIYEIDNSDKIIDKLYIDVNYDKRGYYVLCNIPRKYMTKIY